MIYRICSECGSEQGLSTTQPINLTCQKCGSPYSRFSKKVHLICSHCEPAEQKPTIVKSGDVHFALCPKCSKSVWNLTSPAKEEAKATKHYQRHEGNDILKIAIPYYAGSKKVERAVRTWLIPEVVFFLTDRLCIPPGSGICSQIYLERNANDLLKKKEKVLLPIVSDVFRELVKAFPDCKYYGYFNSDIILPPGKNVYNLLPTEKKVAVLHHRLEVAGKDFVKVDELAPHSVTVVGKDGFIMSSAVVKTMLKEFPNMIIGRPFWDTALALWLWKKYGWEKIDFAYREVWHASHKSGAEAIGDYDFEGSKFNREQGSKVFKHDYSGQVWKDVCSETLSGRQNLRSKKIGIIQPGRVGDILLVLPIAKWYYDRGWEVVWPVYKNYAEIFDRANYVKPIIVKSWEGLYDKCKGLVEAESVDEVIDLAIGFGRSENDWLTSKLSFDEWKYREAKVPFHEKYRLEITRDPVKERQLVEELDLGRFTDGYVVTHSNSSFAEYDFNIPAAIEVEELGAYHLFDWLTVIEGARYIYCVDSAVANLIDLLDIGRERRYIQTWHFMRNLAEAERLTPRFSMWETASFVGHMGSMAGGKYPDYINDNNAMSHIVNRARKWCKGSLGVDIGGGANPFPGAQSIDLEQVDLNADMLSGVVKKNRNFIFSSHCLEHLKNPAEVIVQMFKMLKPGGVLFLYLPHPYNAYWHPDCPQMKGEYGHKHILEPSVVKEWVEAAGFKIEEMTTEPDHYYSYYIAASCKAIKKRRKSQETRIKQRSVKRKLKIATVTIAYNAMPFIEYCVRMVKQFADQVIVVEGIVEKLFNNSEHNLKSDDGTYEFLTEAKDINAVLTKSAWESKMAMQNEALGYVDADYVWLIDSDEFYLQKDIEKVVAILAEYKPEQVNLPLYNFFKTPRWIMNSTDEMFKFLTTEVVRIFKVKQGMRFTDHRPPTINYKVKKLISGRDMLRRDIRIYHFPYCFYNQVMLKAALYTSLHGHNNIKEWFYNFFVPWDEENRTRLEKKWGVWPPDQTSYTQRFKNVVPKAVKPIFKGVEGIKWES